jgi:hypothetical protein
MAQDPRQRPPAPDQEPAEQRTGQEHPDVDPGRGSFEPDSWRPSDAESSPTRVGRSAPGPDEHRRSENFPL